MEHGDATARKLAANAAGVPVVGEPDTLRMDAFPASLKEDGERWVACMSQPDPLDFEAPVRALRPVTIKSYGCANMRNKGTCRITGFDGTR